MINSDKKTISQLYAILVGEECQGEKIKQSRARGIGNMEWVAILSISLIQKVNFEQRFEGSQEEVMWVSRGSVLQAVEQSVKALEQEFAWFVQE